MPAYPTFTPDQLDDILAFFKANNYVVIGGTLSDEDVQFLNAFCERSQKERPDEWGVGKRQLLSHGQILVNYPELDPYVRHANVFPILKAIMGDDIRFSQYDFRDAPEGSGMEVGMGWHQDRPQITRENWDADHPYQCRYLCSIHYLTDVTDDAPCFAVVPNSHPYESMAEAEEKMGDDFQIIPIRGKAGTTVIYNIAIFHTRLAGTSPKGRRTQHTYFSKETSPVLTNWMLLPERLAKHPDDETRAFYSQWTPATIEWVEKGFA
ncbi:MAG: phytanoyl-CoA dioxygenase family protein [Candidatus Poribacteria bacterium]|nr:phytanoyl-CoA dioxygenase family protein [Candidatus Poribacteria bacterium]